jgi:protein-disulfide isomerase
VSPLSAVAERDHMLGSDQPEVTLIEYGDFGCPFCFAAKRPVRSLLDRYDALRLVWRHFPDAEVHPGADLAAELSELAATSGRFWGAHALLLAGRDQFTREGLDSVAAELGLDLHEVTLALNERRLRARVREDVASAERAGVRWTPTFFLNGQRLRCDWRDLAKLVPRILTGSDERA